MNSSTGFKKRSLLRPPSGMLSNSREFLKIIDISQSEPLIASNIRTQVAAIQQQINVLDKDKRIRTGQSSLEKGYILTLKKWLRDVQNLSQKEDDDAKILRQMGVDNYQVGFKKLWKILNHLDLIVSKVTQLEIVQFIKYDQMFQGLAEDSANGQRILQTIAKGGFSPSTFYLQQLALERQIELYTVISELKRANSGNNPNSSKGFTKTRDNTTQLIQQLRDQNRKLTQVLQQIQKQQRQQKNKPQSKSQTQPPKKIQKVVEPPPKLGSSKDMFGQLELKYKQQLFERDNKIAKLSNELSETKINCTQLQARLKAAQAELKNGQVKDNRKPPAGTYEQALLQQMDKMKRGFERKIQKILDEFATKQRQMRKKQYEYKAENDKIKWQKGLLLKKFDTLSA